MTYSPVSRKAVGLLILVFVLGIALGAVGTTLIGGNVYGALRNTQQEAPLPVRAVARLTNELNLTTDQQQVLDGIFVDMQSGYDAVRLQMSPQIEQVREHGRNRIRQALTSEQLPKFENYLRRLDEERRRRNSNR